jgi:hypothetical protein
MVDAAIDTLIESRAKQNGHAEREDLWAGSVRRYHAGKQRDLRAAWAEFHTGQAERIERVTAALAAEHRRQAEEPAREDQESRRHGSAGGGEHSPAQIEPTMNEWLKARGRRRRKW